MWWGGEMSKKVRTAGKAGKVEKVG
ncbi:MAG: hypothetical protein QG670_261, partial [Thermoproteota archaeon]|nr:hypothetical protein [Thermoproteota archaeon]